MTSAPTFADRPAQPMVGEAWAYRGRGGDPLVQVVVMKVGVKRPPRLLVRFVGDEFEGLQDWVPPGRLKVPWSGLGVYLEWERRWDAVLAVSPERDSPEEAAADIVFDLLIDDDVASLGYNATAGIVKIRDLERLAAYLDVSRDEIAAHPFSFEDDGYLVAPWATARWIAASAAARNSESVMRYVAKDEAEARRDATLGRYSRPVGRFDDGFIPPEICAEVDDEHGKPVRAILRAWCAKEVVGLADELNELQAQIRRVSAVADAALSALRDHGQMKVAARLERELGTDNAPTQRGSQSRARRPPNVGSTVSRSSAR